MIVIIVSAVAGCLVVVALVLLVGFMIYIARKGRTKSGTERAQTSLQNGSPMQKCESIKNKQGRDFTK